MSEDNVVEIQSSDGDILRVHPQGAKLELTLNGTVILGSFARGDGKTGITHPCTPIFGPDKNNLYGLKQHGNMRNEVCDVKKIVDNVVVTHTITDQGYPEGMLLKQVMGIEDGVFSMVMIHTNTGKTKAAVNTGEHCYFDAPQGYKGTKLNGEDLSSLVEENWDGIAVPLKDTNIIEIPGKPTIELTQNGFNKAMVWVGKNPDSKAIDQTYICIEPVEENPAGSYFGSKQSYLMPGQSRSVMFSLALK
jgi:galactose mutarotase-like enzyme